MSDLPMYKVDAGSIESHLLEEKLRLIISLRTEGDYKGKYFLEAHSVTPQVGNHTLCYVLIFRLHPLTGIL